MSSITGSVKTRSAASTSSQNSAVRRKAELAKLRLAQQRQQDELERQLQEAERQEERRQQDEERRRQDEERRRQDIQRQLRESALAHEVQLLELEADLLEQEEGEVGEDGRVRGGGDGSGVQSSVAARRRSTTDPAPQPPCDVPAASAADRTSRWISDLGGRVPSPERTPPGTWIDRLSISADPEVGQPGQARMVAAPSPLPKLALEKFRGDPLHWPRWSALFKSLVHDRRELSDAERLTHLQTCLEGPARDAVSGLLCDGSLYGEALRELQQQFGDPTAVVRSSIRQVLRLPPVSERSLAGLTELSRALHAAVSVLRTMGHHADLAATTNVAAVVSKLPLTMAWKWGDEVVARKPAQPTLEELDAWLRRQALAARAVEEEPAENGGCRDRENPTARRSRNGRDGSRHGEAGGMAVSRAAGISAATSAPSTPCGCCGGDHGLDSCEELGRMSASDRMQIVTQVRACYVCLAIGYVARSCEHRRKCPVSGCGRFHHRLLHGAAAPVPSAPRAVSDAPQPAPPYVDVASAAQVGTQMAAGANGTPAAGRAQLLLQVASVAVHGPGGSRRVNALLDLGSQLSLVTESLASQLGLTGPVEQLRIATVDSTATRPSRRVRFAVQPLGSCECFDVVNAQTTPTLNVSGQAVNWPVKKFKWPHLADLDLCEATSDGIEVLLGADVFGLIVPREVREGPAGSPSAVRTRLGWIATGRLPAVFREDAVHVNHVRAPSDDALHAQVEQFWLTESFGTKYSSPPRRSKKDETALQMLEASTVLRDGHYETGLLWRRPDVELPDNREAALTRLRHTERKLDRDRRLARRYTDVIESYIRDGYARKVTPDEMPQGRRQWYLPHHGVVCPRKPDKLRVVFDAAARYRGTSLNENLLTGPDLAISLVGVLLRFRQRPFPVSADIRAMYHQVRVTEADQPALRFLWRGADREREPDTYQMQVHVFGAASSSCTANYALRRCASENALEFPEALAAHTTTR